MVKYIKQSVKYQYFGAWYGKFRQIDSIFIRQQTMSMKYFSLLAAMGFAVLSISSSCNNKPRTAQEVLESAGKNPSFNRGAGTYSIDAPEGWRKVDTVISGVKATFMVAPVIENNFRANINVITQRSNLSPEEYYNANILQMSKYAEDFSVIKSENSVINGRKAKKAYYNMKQGGYELSGTSCFIHRGEIVYIITFMCTKGTQEKYLPLAEKALTSLKLS